MFIPQVRCGVLLLLLCSGAAFAQTAVPVFRPTILEAKSYIEVYTVTAENDDQTFVQIQLSITNLGLSEKNATAKILVLHDAEKPWKGNMFCDQKNWSYADAPNPTLTVGACKITQLPGTLECSGTLEGIAFHVVLEGTPRPIETPHTSFGRTEGIRSKSESAADIYQYEVLLPWSKAHTTLTLPGQAQKKLEGSGMLEHSRSAGNPKEISQGWVTFRGYQKGKYFLANFRLPSGGNAPAAGWIWKEGAAAPTGMEGLHVSSTSEGSGASKKDKYTISAIDSSFRITSGDVLYRYSFVDELGPVLGCIIQMVVCNLVTRYYDAQVRFSSTTMPMKGILELMTIE